MKFTQFIVLAAVLAIALLAFTACGTNVSARAAKNSVPAVSQFHDQTTMFQGFAAFEHASMVLEVPRPWVAESVGMPILNVFRPELRDVKQLEGHSVVLAKPKISSLLARKQGLPTNRFTGLAGDHYARAHV